jgi:hypothetical protein
MGKKLGMFAANMRERAVNLRQDRIYEDIELEKVSRSGEQNETIAAE